MSGTHAENEFPQASSGKAVAPIDGLDRAFQTLAERALRETAASSVAIGLLREGGVFCRATAGLPITVVGDPINRELASPDWPSVARCRNGAVTPSPTFELISRFAGSSGCDP